jgi:hypothetical protein
MLRLSIPSQKIQLFAKDSVFNRLIKGNFDPAIMFFERFYGFYSFGKTGVSFASLSNAQDKNSIYPQNWIYSSQKC